jgi:DNA-binding CsgD family transcriptional regulator
MVGRDDELQRLVQLVDAAQPAVAIVAGEPGIGKSRLVQELVSAQGPGVALLIGQADPGALSRPFELLLDAVDGADVDEGLIGTIGEAGQSIVERLRAGLEIVRRLTTPGPSVIVFEDLHWADSESVALFERVADLPGARLLIGTYRPDEVTRRHPVADLLSRLERRHTVTHLRLDRFSLADTSAFLKAVTGRAPSYRSAVALHNRTGGNPFFLEELIKAGGNDVDKLCDQPLPWNLAEALRRQIDDLDQRQTRIVEAAAVLGRKVPFDLLAAVTGSAEDELIGVLRDLVRRGLMVETGDDEFSFRHALTREALVEQMLGRERRRLNGLALETLLDTGSDDHALVAHHALGAGRVDEMVQAARRGLASYLAIGSPYQALQLAEMALDERPDDVELLAGAARAAWLAGLLDDAADHGRRWRSVAATDEERAEALRLLIRLAWEVGRPDEMSDLTEQIREVVERLPTCAARAYAMTAIAQSFMLRDIVDEAVVWADRAIAEGERLDLAEVRLAGQVEKGSALAQISDGVDEGSKLLHDVADEAEDAGQWLLAARAINNLLGADLVSAEPAEIAKMLERMRVDAERAGFYALSVAAYFGGRARLAMQEGDLARAIAAIDEARRRVGGLQRTRQGNDYHGVLLAGLLLEAGDLDRAEALVQNLSHSYKKHKMSGTAAPGLAFHLACRRNDPERAARLLASVLAAVESLGFAPGDYVHDLVAGAIFAGLPASSMRPLVGRMDSSFVEEHWRQLVLGQLAEAEGDPAGALPYYLTAVESSTLPPVPRGTAHAGAARSLIAAGRLDQAREHVQRADSLLARWGGWRVAEVAALRGRVGLPATRGAGDEASALTPREWEVATLLAEGLTNAELARRLYISPRTAAVHVSNILSKLNLSSRTEVGAWVRQREAAGS